MRVTNDQWNLLVSFAETHPQIITNKFHGKDGKQQKTKLWGELMEKLNSLGYGKKSLDDWKRALTDWKCKVKTKAAKIRRGLSKTNGEQSVIVLSSVEERLLAIMEVNCKKELGISINRNVTMAVSDAYNDDVEEQVPSKYPRCFRSTSPEIQCASTSSVSDHMYESEIVVNTEDTSSTEEEIKKKKTEDVLNDTNSETINVLCAINQNISEMKEAMVSIAESLEIIANKLK